MAEPCKYFTIKRLADRWDVSQPMVRKLIDDEKLACLRIGRSIRITPSQVEAFECRQQSNTNYGSTTTEPGMSHGPLSVAPGAFQRGLKSVSQQRNS